MLLLAVAGFTLMNVLGVVFLPRFTVNIYIWYVLTKWGYFSNDAPSWMVPFAIVLFFSTIAFFVWDILRALNFFSDDEKIF